MGSLIPNEALWTLALIVVGGIGALLLVDAVTGGAGPIRPARPPGFRCVRLAHQGGTVPVLMSAERKSGTAADPFPAGRTVPVRPRPDGHTPALRQVDWGEVEMDGREKFWEDSEFLEVGQAPPRFAGTRSTGRT